MIQPKIWLLYNQNISKDMFYKVLFQKATISRWRGPFDNLFDVVDRIGNTYDFPAMLCLLAFYPSRSELFEVVFNDWFFVMQSNEERKRRYVCFVNTMNYLLNEDKFLRDGIVPKNVFPKLLEAIEKWKKGRWNY